MLRVEVRVVGHGFARFVIVYGIIIFDFIDFLPLRPEAAPPVELLERVLQRLQEIDVVPDRKHQLNLTNINER